MIALKHQFPFRLATTSFIYPADYATNVRRLSPRIDEVELLFFESRPESLPSKEVLHQLAAMAPELDLTYNVHLPLDIDLSVPQERQRRNAVHRMAAIIEQTTLLNPTTFTLHLDCNLTGQTMKDITTWQSRTSSAVANLIDACPVDGGRISIETLHYPPQWFAPIVTEMDLTVCLDVGHIVRYGYDLDKAIDDYAPRISIVHLHGVCRGEDHRSLVWLDQRSWDILVPFLTEFTGSVSIEVFSAQRLDRSLYELKRMLAV
jgi:sugar phosphate isomerase/epimerase